MNKENIEKLDALYEEYSMADNKLREELEAARSALYDINAMVFSDDAKMPTAIKKQWKESFGFTTNTGLPYSVQITHIKNCFDLAEFIEFKLGKKE